MLVERVGRCARTYLLCCSPSAFRLPSCGRHFLRPWYIRHRKNVSVLFSDKPTVSLYTPSFPPLLLQIIRIPHICAPPSTCTHHHVLRRVLSYLSKGPRRSSLHEMRWGGERGDESGSTKALTLSLFICTGQTTTLASKAISRMCCDTLHAWYLSATSASWIMGTAPDLITCGARVCRCRSNEVDRINPRLSLMSIHRVHTCVNNAQKAWLGQERAYLRGQVRRDTGYKSERSNSW